MLKLISLIAIVSSMSFAANIQLSFGGAIKTHEQAPDAAWHESSSSGK